MNSRYLSYISLSDKYLIPLPRGRRATMPRKETRRKEQRKNESGQRVKLSTPTQAIDARMGEEEKNRKQKGEQKKETGSGPPAQLPRPSVASYDPYGSYGGPTLKPTPPTGC